MKIALSLLGSKIISALFKFVSSTGGKIAIGVSLLYVLLLLIPFNIGLPQEIISVITDGFLKELLISITFFFPVKFALSCLILILLAKHTSIISGIIKIVYRIMGGNKSGN